MIHPTTSQNSQVTASQSQEQADFQTFAEISFDLRSELDGISLFLGTEACDGEKSMENSVTLEIAVELDEWAAVGACGSSASNQPLTKISLGLDGWVLSSRLEGLVV